MVTFKTTLKSIGVILITFCATFLETLFLSYKIDLMKLDTSSFNEFQNNVYQAQLSLCNMMNLISVGLLGIFAFIILFFSIERYIEENKANMGVLKALGYSNKRISVAFMKFSLPVLVGSSLGYLLALAFSSLFYKTMNGDHVYPDVYFNFNAYVFIGIVFLLPLLTILFAYVTGMIKLKAKPLDMINQVEKKRHSRLTKEKPTFLKEVRSTMLKNHIALLLFVGFATMCFSSCIQMAVTMYHQANTSPLFFWMMLGIGLLLGITILILSFKFVFKANMKHMQIFKAYGYQDKECYYAMYGGYHIVSLIAFIIGTLYQVLILSIMFKAFASSYGIDYHFDWLALLYSLIIFVICYVLVNTYYYLKIRKLKLDSLNTDLG